MARRVTLRDADFIADTACTCGGTLSRKEIHLRLLGLRSNRAEIRVYTKDSHQALEFSGIVSGTSTHQKVRCGRYVVQNRIEVSPDGLIYFIPYDGDFGFHSNYYKRADGTITRIPGSISHGCARLNDSQAPVLRSNGTVTHDRRNTDLDSFLLFSNVSDNDIVRVYSRSNGWYRPTFRRVCRGR